MSKSHTELLTTRHIKNNYCDIMNVPIAVSVDWKKVKNDLLWRFLQQQQKLLFKKSSIFDPILCHSIDVNFFGQFFNRSCLNLLFLDLLCWRYWNKHLTRWPSIHRYLPTINHEQIRIKTSIRVSDFFKPPQNKRNTVKNYLTKSCPLKKLIITHV